MSKKFTKEPTITTLRSEIKKILDSYYPYNNFQVSMKTQNNTLNIYLEGCDFGEEFKNMLTNFVKYKLKNIYRKKTVREENKIKVIRIPYQDFLISFHEDCSSFSYYRYL